MTPPPHTGVGASRNISWIPTSKPELMKDVQRYLWIFYFCGPCTTMSGKRVVGLRVINHIC